MRSRILLAPRSLRPPRALLRRRITLRTRLALIYGGTFLVAGVLLLGVTYTLFDQQIGGTGTRIFTAQKGDKDEKPPLSGDEPQVKGKILGQSPDASPPPDATEAEKWMAEQQEQLRDAATTSLVTQGGIALLVVGGAATAFGWLVAGRVLAPLHRVTDTARRIAGAPAADRGLHERIALTGPDDEVKDLADTFDTMLERLDRSFDGQRRFVANASHELRTPLTLGRALVELAMHRPTASDDVKRLGTDLLEINIRHERLIGGLLMLAGSEREVTERLPVDMADVVDHVIVQTAPEAEQAGVTVHGTADEALTGGDALLLERLVYNLVENGIRHNTGDGGWVGVTSGVRAGKAVVEVGNTGPVVPPYEVAALFEPFRRLGDDRVATTKGAGLGLSIVRSVARAHGGDAAARPREGGGMTVTVTLPLCDDTEPAEPA
ncbi:signal transduction histidine kinase [Murinocardiopsis flavida]|uniref:histidine kinase n=1 Tax=Murinocardiopsis flavida TaxID=645275 RepID=A0A2P8DDX3_9ACTN|nr:HAMP domain-containing sensor histidine kinase [Murinocardiopsis flavida]PSK95402.1 signal transduction histidine kinase [Murinocardiopsis flavida]